MAFAAARMIKEKKEQESRKSSSSRTMNKVTKKADQIMISCGKEKAPRKLRTNLVNDPQNRPLFIFKR